MPEIATLLVFAVAAAALVAIPGPNLVYIGTRSLSEGRRAGFASALGVEAGTLVHVAAAAGGLSALIASSATAFTAVKYVGAAYLLYLGVRALLRRDAPEHSDDRVTTPLGRAFAEGLLVNVLNPKVSLFFLAFLPQFIDPARGAMAVQALVLGAVFFVVAFTMDLLYVAAAGALGDRLQGRRSLTRATGVVYLALGTLAAFAGGPRRS